MEKTIPVVYDDAPAAVRLGSIPRDHNSVSLVVGRFQGCGSWFTLAAGCVGTFSHQICYDSRRSRPGQRALFQLALATNPAHGPSDHSLPSPPGTRRVGESSVCSRIGPTVGPGPSIPDEPPPQSFLGGHHLVDGDILKVPEFDRSECCDNPLSCPFRQNPRYLSFVTLERSTDAVPGMSRLRTAVGYRSVTGAEGGAHEGR